MTGRQRASDADRDQLLGVLQNAYAAGRLDPAEFGERQDKALRLKFTDEMAELVNDLPEAQEAGLIPMRQHTRGSNLPAATQQTLPTQSILSENTFVLPAGTTYFRNSSFGSSDQIYLDDVIGPGIEVVLEIPSVMGSRKIYVPDGVRIIDECTSILGESQIDHDVRGDGSNGTLILRGKQIMTSYKVRSSVRQKKGWFG